MKTVTFLSKYRDKRAFSTAFTMLELVIVILIIAVLVSLVIPRYKRDLRQEASEHLLGMIRYTQNLALHDNKFDPSDPTWERRYWKFMLSECSGQTLNHFYMIGSDSNGDSNGRFEKNEAATDPANGKALFWVSGSPCPYGGKSQAVMNVSPNIFISQRYGIKSYSFKGGCSGKQSVGFDRFGRPYTGFGKAKRPVHQHYLSSDCEITFTFKDQSISPFTIIIEAESGYARLLDYPEL